MTTGAALPGPCRGSADCRTGLHAIAGPSRALTSAFVTGDCRSRLAQRRRRESLPRGKDAYNVQEKLRDYSLNLAHTGSGRYKAAGFSQILGITLEDIDYLAAALLAGARDLPVTIVRPNPPFGLNCNIVVPVRGLREHAERVVNVLTSWELRFDGDRP